MKPSPSDHPGKSWHVGTLVYTTGGLIILFCWLLAGDFAWSMKERSATAVLQVLLRKFDASDLLGGVLIGSLPAAMTLLLGPAISYQSDRHRGPWGRRIPFLAMTVPVAVLATIGLAFSPQIGACLHRLLGMHSPGLNDSVLFFFGLFWTLFEFASVTTNSLFASLINDVVPTAVLGRFYGVFRALSLIAGIIFGFCILGDAEKSYVWIFLGLGALYGVGFSLMCLKVKEGTYPSVPSTEPGLAEGFLTAIKAYFKDCFSHAYYLWFYVAFCLAWIMGIPINLFSVFFAKSLSMDIVTYGKCMGLTYFISLILAYPLGVLVDRFHPMRMSLIMVVLYAFVTLAGWLSARDAWTFGVVFVAHGVVGGAWLTAAASLCQRLLPAMKFAQFYSAAMIIISICTVVIGPVMGSVLDYAHHAYRYTFLASFGLTVLAVVTNFILYRKFLALGGPKNYIAP